MKIGIWGLAVVLIGPTAMFSQSSRTGNLPPGFIDGSKNPDQIPDSAAYRLVFLSLKEPDPGNQTAVAGRAAALGKIGLSAADLAILSQQLAAFAASYRTLQTQVVSAAAAPVSLHGQVVTLVLATRNALLRQLSPDGIAKFSAYVQSAKSRMIVRP